MVQKIKHRALTAALVALLLVISMVSTVLAAPYNSALTVDKESDDSFYVGVTFGGNTVAEAKLLVDRVKSYTNLFVIQSGPVSKNEPAMTEISKYVIDAGLNLIVYIGWLDLAQPWQLPWLEMAKEGWGEKFLGVYFDDEPIGIPLDYNWAGYFDAERQQNSTTYRSHAFAIDGILNGTYPHDHDEAALLSRRAIEGNLAPLKNSSLTVFTSDYVLYWFGYIGGYDVMLTQLGFNESITQNIAQMRGAARMQNKDWGAIITWKYTQPPYLDSGEEVYNQMLTSYQAGAKYVVIFNYPQIEDNPYGTLLDEHFEALEKFWHTITDAPKVYDTDFSQAEAALVLPRNYGWGMRRPDDRIWGYWGPDDKSEHIWNISRSLLSEYGLRLDIICEDPQFPLEGKYSKVYYWNQTVTFTESSQLNMHNFHSPFAIYCDWHKAFVQQIEPY